MNGRLTTGRLPGAHIEVTTTATGPLTLTVNGRPARLALLDEAGHILAEGPSVAAELKSCTLNAWHAFWRGQGHLRASNVQHITHAPVIAPAAAGRLRAA